MLSTPINGNAPYCDNGNNYGSSCVFTCKDGFTLSSTTAITCNANGNSPDGIWSANEPVCTGIMSI